MHFGMLLVMMTATASVKACNGIMHWDINVGKILVRQ